jgi:hypothetical protein
VQCPQLAESVARTFGRAGVLEGFGEQIEDVVISPEVGEVFEREVDRADGCAGTAQITKFVELSLSAGHALTIHRGADFPLHWD